MTCIDKTFYLENLKALFCSIQVVPTTDMNLEEQLNAITRLILMIFIIMILFNFVYSMHFLIFSLLFIISIYYIQKMKNKIQKENYEPSIRDNIYYVPYKEPKLKSGVEYINGEKIKYIDIPIPETNLFAGNKIPVGGPNDPPSNWNNELTRGGNIDFRNKSNPPSWINDLDTGGSPTTGANREFGEYGGNPLTKIKPVVTPPAYALDYWKDNNTVVISQINSVVQEDMYLSGYAESSCCDYLPNGTELVPRKCNNVINEGYSDERTTSLPEYSYNAPYCRGRRIIAPVPVQSTIQLPSIQENYIDKEDGADGKSYDMEDLTTSLPEYSYNSPNCRGRGIVAPIPVQSTIQIPYIKEGYNSLPSNVMVMPEHPGMMNTSCGYNPEQIFNSNLPSNYPAGNCEQSPFLKKFNENLYTQIVTPGVYTRNEINEPINSNIGISLQQQFEPTTVTRDEKGLHYLQHDPRVVSTNLPVQEKYEKDEPNYDNVYDPRFSGYGTSYRSYFEPVTGQTRFMYDDVNAIRMPNYVVRSKIDHLPYADTYGPVQEGSEFGNIHNPHIRYLAQDSWMRDSLDFRNDMTQLLMRKRNSEAWQQRQAPLGPRSLVRRGGV
jgi:hypothetical protein